MPLDKQPLSLQSKSKADLFKEKSSYELVMIVMLFLNIKNAHFFSQTCRLMCKVFLDPVHWKRRLKQEFNLNVEVHGAKATREWIALYEACDHLSSPRKVQLHHALEKFTKQTPVLYLARLHLFIKTALHNVYCEFVRVTPSGQVSEQLEQRNQALANDIERVVMNMVASLNLAGYPGAVLLLARFSFALFSDFHAIAKNQLALAKSDTAHAFGYCRVSQSLVSPIAKMFLGRLAKLALSALLISAYSNPVVKEYLVSLSEDPVYEGLLKKSGITDLVFSDIERQSRLA